MLNSQRLLEDMKKAADTGTDTVLREIYSPISDNNHRLIYVASKREYIMGPEVSLNPTIPFEDRSLDKFYIKYFDARAIMKAAEEWESIENRAMSQLRTTNNSEVIEAIMNAMCQATDEKVFAYYVEIGEYKMFIELTYDTIHYSLTKDGKEFMPMARDSYVKDVMLGSCANKVYRTAKERIEMLASEGHLDAYLHN